MLLPAANTAGRPTSVYEKLNTAPLPPFFIKYIPIFILPFSNFLA